MNKYLCELKQRPLISKVRAPGTRIPRQAGQGSSPAPTENARPSYITTRLVVGSNIQS